MATTILPLNLDPSFPDSDPRNGATNNAGVIRFIDSGDDYTLDPMNRVFGDVVKRFILNESKINELVQLFTSNPQLSTFDNTPYVLVDGTHVFTAPISGVTPTIATHLVTKGYVDNQLSTTNGVIQTLSGEFSTLQAQVPNIRRSPWNEFIWSGGTPQVVDLVLTPSVINMDNVISIVIMEKLDIAQPTDSDPDPDAIWIYRQLSHGTCGDGIRVDDVWLLDNVTVRTLIPSTSEYSPGYPSSSGYGAVANPRQRFLSAIVTETISP